MNPRIPVAIRALADDSMTGGFRLRIARRASLIIFLVSAFFGPPPSSSSGQEGVENPFKEPGMSLGADGQVTLTFSGFAGEAPDGFGLEASKSLGGTVWGMIQSVSVDAPAPGKWRLVFDDFPDRSRLFFRIVKDGLPITAAFGVDSGQVREGDPSAGVPVTLSRPLFGGVRFEIDPGDGSPPQSGVFNVDGDADFLLPVPPPVDDDVISPLSYLSVTLAPAEGDGIVLLDPAVTISVVVEDNDAAWIGILADGSNGNVPVVLKVLQDAGGIEALLSPNTGSGTPGFLPPGDHATTGFSMTPGDTFELASLPISLPPGSPPFDGPTSMTLVFTADDAEDGESVSVGLIEGVFTLNTSFTDYPFLNNTREGTFILQRIPSGLPANAPPLVTVPDI